MIKNVDGMWRLWGVGWMDGWMMRGREGEKVGWLEVRKKRLGGCDEGFIMLCYVMGGRAGEGFDLGFDWKLG